MKRKFITIMAAMTLAVSFGPQASAQSKNFQLGQWVEIQNAILKTLNNSYVDTLPVNRMMKSSINSMLQNLDPYTIYVPEEENEDFQMMISNTYGGIGAIIHKKIDANVVINEPYMGSPAWKNGLVCGDEIISIDGVPTKGLTAAESSSKMKGRPKTDVKFKVKKLRTNDTIDLSITRERIHLPDIEYAGMLDDTTGYILQTGFTENVGLRMKEKVLELKEQGMKKLFLDLRGNGGGLMNEAVNIVSLFVPKGTLVVSAKAKDQKNTIEYKTYSDPIDTELPIVVLIDGASASSAEIVTGALQDLDRATVMGKRSYGKGLVQSVRPLPYNGQLKVTTAKYYTPSGRCVQAIDYAQRNEDGSVGHIPDSLTHEFKTASGRIVRDGGGITPDIELELPTYSRIVYSIVLGGVVDEYVLNYVRKHDSIAKVEDFHFSDADYEDFIAFAKTQDFDYRSGAKTLYDQLKKELERDGLAEMMTDELSAMDKALEMDKEKILRHNKEQIIPFIEEELVTRYWYQEAGVQIRLRHDEQLHKAMQTPMIHLN